MGDRISELEELVGKLLARIAELESRNAELERNDAELRRQLEDAQREAARQAAPFRRAEERLKPIGEHKRPGRRKGHPGSFRRVPERIDETVEVPLPVCPRCGGPVTGDRRIEQMIQEIPAARPHNTRLITHRATCRHCGEVSSGHPLQVSAASGAAGCHLGPRATALAVSLKHLHGMTMRRICKVLGEGFGLTLTPGGLAQAIQRVAGKCRGKYAELAAAVRQSAASYTDETSWYVGKPGWWLWVFTTPGETLYVVDSGRGSQVVNATLGENFGGVPVSDCLSSYDPPTCAKHKCVAHHLRAIAKAQKLPGQENAGYLGQWRLLFTGLLGLWKSRPHIPPGEWPGKVHAMEAMRDDLLAHPGGGPGDVRIHHRLEKQKEHLLGCLKSAEVEPTNNRAERALRPAVIARKLSCGNRTEAGKKAWECLASLAVTAVQRGQSAMDCFAALLPLAVQGR